MTTANQPTGTKYQSHYTRALHAQEAARQSIVILRRALRGMLLDLRAMGYSQKLIATRFGLSQSRLSAWGGRESRTLDAQAVIRAYPFILQAWEEAHDMKDITLDWEFNGMWWHATNGDAHATAEPQEDGRLEVCVSWRGQLVSSYGGYSILEECSRYVRACVRELIAKEETKQQHEQLQAFARRAAGG
jgi:hypothetical protein